MSKAEQTDEELRRISKTGQPDEELQQTDEALWQESKKEQTDEELQRMIQEIEDDGILQAPAYLKGEILEAVSQMETGRIPNDAVEQDTDDALMNIGKAVPEKSLKENIMQKNMLQKNILRSRNRVRRRLEWIAYAIEVGVVTAAAVMLVLMVPAQDTWDAAGMDASEWDGSYAQNTLPPETEEQQRAEWFSRKEAKWEQDMETRQQISDAVSGVTEKIVGWGSFLLPDEEEDWR